MLNKILASLAIVFLTTAALAQENVKKAARPNIPGSFIVDLGVNRGLSTPENFSQGFWGSRTVNLYYQYPIRFGKTKFSFNPGLGLSLERWKFTNNRILSDQAVNNQYELELGSSIHPGIKKSMFITNYFEVPLEFRFDTNPNDIARSFSWALGGRIGVLTNGMTKVKFTEDGETTKDKDKSTFGLNTIRYGVYSRVGIGGFNWFAFYNLSDMFQSGKGPADTTMNSMTIGISINGF